MSPRPVPFPYAAAMDYGPRALRGAAGVDAARDGIAQLLPLAAGG
jgi:hypothetical protein